jgi:hypothetical protein
MQNNWQDYDSVYFYLYILRQQARRQKTWTEVFEPHVRLIKSTFTIFAVTSSIKLALTRLFQNKLASSFLYAYTFVDTLCLMVTWPAVPAPDGDVA